MRHALTTAAAAALLFTAACGSSAPDLPEHEQAFLDDLHEGARAEGSGIHGFAAQDNIDLGYAVCDDLDSGMSPAEVVASLDKPEGEETPISKAAVPLVESANEHLCPQE